MRPRGSSLRERRLLKGRLEAETDRDGCDRKEGRSADEPLLRDARLRIASRRGRPVLGDLLGDVVERHMADRARERALRGLSSSAIWAVHRWSPPQTVPRAVATAAPRYRSASSRSR